MHQKAEIHRFYTRRRAQLEQGFGIDQEPIMAEELVGSTGNQNDEEREMVRTLITTHPKIVQALDRLQDSLEHLEMGGHRGG